MNRSKKVTRIINTLCLVCSIFIGSFLLSVPAKAETNTHTTSYGSWSLDYQEATVGVPVNFNVLGVGVGLTIPFTSGSGFTLSYNFNQLYSGYINITISMPSTTSKTWAVQDCYLGLTGAAFYSLPNTTTYTQSKTFRIECRNTSGFTFNLFIDGASGFGYIPDVTFSYSNFYTDNDLDKIDTRLTNWDTYISGMSNSLLAISQTLGQPNIYNSLTEAVENIAYFVSNDLDNYLSDIDGYLYLLNMLNDTTTGVGYLQEIYTAIQNLPGTIDYSSYFNSIITSILNIQTDVDSINTNVSNIYSRLNSFNTTLTAISTSLQNSFHSNLNVPRWQLPAMRWANDVCYTSGQYSAWSLTTTTGWFQRYSNPAGDLAFTSSKAVYVPIDSKYIIAWASVSSGAGCNIYYSRSGNIETLPTGVTVDEFYGSTSNGGYRNGLYFNYVIITNNYSASNNEAIGVEVEFTTRRYITPLYVGLYNNMPQEAYSLIGLKYIDPNTSILSNIDSTVSNIEQYLSNLSPDQTVIDQSTTIVNNFDNSINAVNTIENNILTDIDVQFDNVNQIITDQSMHNVHPVSADQGIQLFEFYLGKINHAWPGFNYVIYLILILFVLLCLLG